MDCVLVHTLWQGSGLVHIKRCQLTLADPAPVYAYQMHGQTLISPSPLYRVIFYAGGDLEHGVADAGDLEDCLGTAGMAQAWLRSWELLKDATGEAPRWQPKDRDAAPLPLRAWTRHSRTVAERRSGQGREVRAGRFRFVDRAGLEATRQP